MRAGAAELRVLPLSPDWSGAFGISPNGDFFSFSYEKPYEIKKDCNRRKIKGILFQGLKNYPELCELLPIRAPDSIVCDYRQGTGIAPLAELLNNSNIVGYFGG